MHTYRRIQDVGGPQIYTVGFFDHTIGWHALQDCASQEEAIALVSYLNGGPGTSLVLQALALALSMLGAAPWVSDAMHDRVLNLNRQLGTLIRLVDQHKPDGF